MWVPVGVPKSPGVETPASTSPVLPPATLPVTGTCPRSQRPRVRLTLVRCPLARSPRSPPAPGPHLPALVGFLIASLPKLSVVMDKQARRSRKPAPSPSPDPCLDWTRKLAGGLSYPGELREGVMGKLQNLGLDCLDLEG